MDSESQLLEQPEQQSEQVSDASVEAVQQIHVEIPKESAVSTPDTLVGESALPLSSEDVSVDTCTLSVPETQSGLVSAIQIAGDPTPSAETESDSRVLEETPIAGLSELATQTDDKATSAGTSTETLTGGLTAAAESTQTEPIAQVVDLDGSDTEAQPAAAPKEPVNPRALARAQEREAALTVKRLLVEQAERGAVTWSREQGLSEMPRLMGEWKQVPRAGKSADNELWVRFKTAQDLFYTRIGLERRQKKEAAEKAAAAAARRREGTQARQEIMDKARTLIGSLDIGTARATMRELNEAYYASPSPGGSAVRKMNAEFNKIKDEFYAWVRAEPERRKASPDRDLYFTRSRRLSQAAQVRAEITRLEDELVQALPDDPSTKRQHGGSILLSLGDSSVYGKLTAELMRQRVRLDQLNTQIASLEAKIAATEAAQAAEAEAASTGDSAATEAVQAVVEAVHAAAESEAASTSDALEATDSQNDDVAEQIILHSDAKPDAIPEPEVAQPEMTPAPVDQADTKPAPSSDLT